MKCSVLDGSLGAIVFDLQYVLLSLSREFVHLKQINVQMRFIYILSGTSW